MISYFFALLERASRKGEYFIVPKRAMNLLEFPNSMVFISLLVVAVIIIMKKHVVFKYIAEFFFCLDIY
jgi:hypothetical protein